MAWPPDFRSATKATCPRSFIAFPTGSPLYGLPGLVSAMDMNVYDSNIRSSRASRVNRRAAGRWPGEGRRRVRVWGELGLREFRIEESHINHDLHLKAVCRRMATATFPARRPSTGAVPGR